MARNIAVDSRGNLSTTGVDTDKRTQPFRPVKRLLR
jgi:hypothetical protein